MNGQGLGDMSGFGTGEDMLDLGALFGGGDGMDASSSSSLMNQGYGAPASQPSSTIDLQSIFPDQSSSAMAGPSAGGWMSNAGQPQQQQSNNAQQSSYANNSMAGQGGVNPGMFTNGQQVGTPGGTTFDAASMQYNPQLQQILQQQRLHQQQQQQQQQLQQAQAQNQQRWGGGGGMSPGAHQGASQAPQQHVFAQQQQAGLVTPNQMHASSPAASFDPSQMHLPQQSPSHPQPGNPFGYSAQNLNPFQSPNPMGHMQQSPAMNSPYQHQQMTAQQQQQRQQQLQQQQQQQQRRPPPQSPQQAQQVMGSHIDPTALSNQGQPGFAGMSPQGQNQMYAPSPSAQQQGSRRAPSVSNAMSPGQMTSASGASPPAGPGTPQAGSSTPVLKAKLPRGRPRKKGATDANNAANAPTPSTVASPGPSRSASFSQSNTQPNGTNQAPTPTPSHAPTPGPESAGPSAAPTPKPAAAALASTSAPPGPRPTGMQPQQLQQMLVTQAYSQFAANMRAQDRARNGQAPPGPHYGGTLIPVNTVPGVGQLSWTPTVAPEVQQRFLELAVQVAKVQAHTSGSQTSPSQVLAAWGMMYIPPQAVPQGVPCSSSKGGAIVTLGDGRLLGVCGQEEQVAFVNLLKQQMQNFKNQSTQRNVQPLQWANLIHQHVMGEQQKTLTQAQTLLSNAINAANAGRGATGPGMQPPNVPQQQIPAQPQGLPQYQQAQGQQVRPPPQQSPVPGQQPNLAHQQASLHQQQQHQAMAAAQAAQTAALQRAQSAQGSAAVQPGTPAHLQQQQQLQMQAQQQLAQAKLGATQAGHSARSPVPPSAIGQAPITAGHLQSGQQGTALTLQQQLAAQAAAQVTAAHPAALPDMKPVNLPPVEGGEVPTHTGLGTKIINAMAQVTALPPSLRKPDGTPAWTPLTDRQRAKLRQAIVKDDAFVKSREEIHEQTKQKAAKWARELWSEPPKWTVRNIVPSVKGSEERDGADQKPAQKQQARDVTAKLRGHDTKVESTWAWWEAPEDEDQLPQYSANHPQAREVPGAMEPFRLIMPAEKRERAMKVGSCGRASRLLAPTLCGSRHTVVTTSVRDITTSAPTPQAYQLVSTLPEELVPVRLEIDADGWKLRDTFTWNGADEHLPPELFAQVLCDEIALPHHLFVQPIILAIQQQVRDYQLARVLREAGSGAHEEAAIHHTELQVPAGEEGDDVERTADEALQSSLVANGADAEAPQRGITRLATRAGEPLVGAGKLDAKAAKWWKRWREDVEKKEDELAALDGADGASIDELKRKRADEQSAADKRRKIDEVDIMEVDGDGEEVVDDPLVNEVLKDELRILVKLDITVGAMNLVDQFEWDLGDPRNSPEDFAATFAADLGLSGEFRTAIVHSIREQVAVHLNSLALIGHPFDGTPVADEDLRTAFLPSVAPQADAEGSLFENLMRNDADVDAFTPRLLQLSEDEIQRLDRERERDAKRKKRQTRGRRGVNLPDRDPIKTQRTPVIHGHQTGALDTSESLPTFTAATGLSSRPQRRAAVTAREGFNLDGTSSGTTSAQETAPVSVLAPGGPTIKTRRFRLSNYAVQFAYPGGLGRAEDPGGPKFTSGEAKENPPTPVRPKTESRGPRRPSPPRDPAVEKALTRQHPNVFDGLWHCGNCGIPATLTTSRRKGPAGDKTMCAPCGKHWNRYRKALPVEYTRDEDYHAAQLAAKNKSHKAQASVGARGSHAGGDEEEWGNASTMDTPHQREGSQAVATQSVDAAESKLAAIAPSVASSTRGQSPDLPFLQVGSPDDSNNSSDSRSPSPALDVRRGNQARGPSPPKRSGAGLVEPRGNGLSIAAPALVRSVSASSAQNADGSPAPSAHALGASPPPPPAGVSTATPAPSPPAWLEREMRSLSARYPNDRFDTLLKASRAGAPPAPAPEWRIRCADCPGKVYVPGPNETLENFMLHLRNRKHRAAVADRVAGRAGSANASAGAGAGAAASADTPATPAPAPAAGGLSEQSNTNDADTSMAPP